MINPGQVPRKWSLSGKRISNKGQAQRQWIFSKNKYEPAIVGIKANFVCSFCLETPEKNPGQAKRIPNHGTSPRITGQAKMHVPAKAGIKANLTRSLSSSLGQKFANDRSHRGIMRSFYESLRGWNINIYIAMTKRFFLFASAPRQRRVGIVYLPWRAFGENLSSLILIWGRCFFSACMYIVLKPHRLLRDDYSLISHWPIINIFFTTCLYYQCRISILIVIIAPLKIGSPKICA